ncbi:membrane protein insertase YidC [Cellvibrio zantedeschiae]|uniref:Membrane protein insertase YidC n=1 Tax=Cellvibrio zantedeschiae TaxID=1237077 RepID=A0ABQ3B8M7_9GAMM|nr:membrane protein insertase YidC [Cellvibrio zantedeschiae]GGY84217.1 membrane protein insertase YidC [Cellvibrio zantedeschiae]
MDWQKNILIAAILAVLFMLAIRWNTYQELHAPLVAPVSTTEIPAAAAKSSDIPAATANASAPTNVPAAVSTSVIKVATDSLLVNIDPVGGDIVRVALPRHLIDIKNPDSPFVLIDNTPDHLYRIQSGLVGANATDTAQGRPTYSVEKSEYALENGKDTLTVDLSLQQDQVKITKRFTFTRGQYVVGVEYLIDNQSANKWNGQLYGQIKRDSKDFAKTNAMMMSAYLGGAVTTKEENYKKVKFDDLRKAPFETTEQGGWVSLIQHYFISAWIPDPATTNTFKLSQQGTNDVFLFSFIGSPVEVAPGAQGSVKANFYAGPKDTDALEKISPHLDLTVDYGFLWMIGEPLFWLLKHIHAFLGNWGLAIIGLTVIVKALFFHLSAASYRSMAKMKKLAPKMAEMKERYGDDRQKMSQEMMKLYKDEKVNPLGGCLPMLIQMPVFLALYWVLMESVELRHAPFYGWIQDLSVMDPYYVLPLIYGVTMWFMQKLNPQPTDPMQARVMQMLPLVFTFMFLWFPAGLVLYWVTNNILTIAQQYVITKQIENADTSKA